METTFASSTAVHPARMPVVAMSLLLAACGGGTSTTAPATSPTPATTYEPVHTLTLVEVDAPFQNAEAALAAIAPGSRRLDAAVQAIVASGDRAAMAKADLKLVDVTRWIASPAWRDANRARLVEANEASKLSPSEKQFTAQLQLYQDETHVRALVSMERLGGPISVDYCRGVARDAAAATSVRAAALRVVDRFAPSPDLDNARAEIAARAAAEAAEEKRSEDVMRTLAALKPLYKKCWNEELARNAAVVEIAPRLTLTVATSGEVTAVSVADLADGPLSACLVGVARSAKFSPLDAQKTLVVPLRLMR